MKITSQASFEADPQAVYQMLITQEYLERVAQASHAQSYECSVTGSQTRSSRTLPAPPEAQRFVGATITVVEEIAWDEAAADGSRTGRLSMTVPGQPVQMNGQVLLAPGGPGTTVGLDAELKVNIPLLGKKLEQSAAPAVRGGFDVQQQVGREWLAERR